MEQNIENGNVPRHVFLTKGTGRHKEKLSSFEMALRDAGIERFNLVRVSSIYPPGCKLIPRKKGLSMLNAGQVVFCVMADNASNEPNRLVAASIGIAIPADEKHYGYLSEHHSFGLTEKANGDYAEDLAAQMLSSTYGIEFDLDEHYDAKKEIFKIDGRIVKTANITQSAIGDKKGCWTTTVAAAVFVP
ncbi:MAG: arginine decarboxylase, pyruvoyl-dependent [Methanobacteriota archaeon]